MADALTISLPPLKISALPELPVITSKVITLCPHIIPQPDSQSNRVEIRVTTEYQEFERLVYQTSTTPYRKVAPVTESQPFNPLCEECYSRRMRYLISLGVGQRFAKQSLSKLRECLSGLIEKYEGYSSEESSKELTLVLSLVRLIDRPSMDEEEYVSWVQGVSFETAAEEACPIVADEEAVAKLDVVDAAEVGGDCENCGVCLLDELKGNGGLRRMPCEHVFHEGCILKWLSNSYFCPLCRFELPRAH